MNVNSISGLRCEVEDVTRTGEFYESIGFRRGKEEPSRATFYVNWFFVTFIDRHAEQGADAGGRREPDGEPERRSSGNREFALRDPDGYNLVFFQKK